MNIPLANGRLGRAAVERYWEDGYLHPIRAISPAQAAEWRAELEAIERDWLDAGLPLPLNRPSSVSNPENSVVMLVRTDRLGTT